MSKKIPALPQDVVDLLLSSGYESLRRRNDGTTSLMRHKQHKGKTVGSRQSNLCESMYVTAPHVGIETVFAYSREELESVLQNIKACEEVLDDTVHKLALEIFNHFHKNNVNVMMNHPRHGVFEFYTHKTISSVKLFTLYGEMDRFNEVEIRAMGPRNNTGPIANLDEMLKVFKEWAEYGDTTARECHSDRTITLDSLEYHIYAMLYRGLKDIQMHTYYVRKVVEDEFLQNLIDRHENADWRKEPHTAHTITWKLNQEQCEAMEGLHA